MNRRKTRWRAGLGLHEQLGVATGRRLVSFENIKWRAIAVALSPYCSYLNISKPNYCWGHGSLKPSNEIFFPVRRKGLLGKGWKRKLSSTLQRSSHLKVSGAHGPARPLPKALKVWSPQGGLMLAGWCVLDKRQPVLLLSGSTENADGGSRVNTDGEVSGWGFLMKRKHKLNAEIRGILQASRDRARIP